MTRLLVLACSATKLAATRPVPAIDLYQGPAFRIVRNAAAAGLLRDTLVLILSAEHGLITPHRMVEPYDTRMDAARDLHFRSDPEALRAAAATIAHATKGFPITNAHCFGGCRYASVVRDYSRKGFIPVPVTWDDRGIGHKLQSLKRWLNGDGTGTQAQE